MGYRSQVLMRIESPNLKEIILEMALTSKINWSAIKTTWVDSLQFNTTRIELQLDQMKWYDTYEEVRMIESFWSYMEDVEIEEGKRDHQNYSLDGVFLRIGEDTNDIEEKFIGNGWELAHVNSFITVEHDWDFYENRIKHEREIIQNENR